ncbi:MAG TPA: CTP synthase [Patescibacteria group bacterium]|jgi:CTP synthase|nr:CTP synthase [Patescibacteria group bacterium]
MSYHVKARKAKKLHTKFIFVSGGVISGVGKGITTASLAAMLQSRGYVVAPVKCDPYLNVDAGTIRPQEHGEVFVTDDGMETDQDLGNYERFLNTDLSKANYVTNGQLYQTLIQKERNFEFKGEDVEVAIHVPEEIINRLEQAARARKADFVICEIGGTVGEYQNILFIEANRIMRYRDGRDTAHVHVAYLPTPPSVGEMKSKPVQNSVKQLISSGIQPDFLVARAEEKIDDRRKQTLAWTTNIPEENIIAAPNVDSIYRVPVNFDKEGLGDKILKQFGMPPKKRDMKQWEKLVKTISATASSKTQLEIAVVGKYFETGAGSFQLSDVYVSVIEALKHAGWANKSKINLNWISSTRIEKEGAAKVLSGFDGICVPGGFGSRGINGLIETVKYARTKNIPYLGLCYGMQLATIEFARSVAKIRNAHTTEVEQAVKHAVIHIMPEQEKMLLKREYGATMRLGAWDCVVTPGTKTEKAYARAGWIKPGSRGKSANTISERHRHRYEFNNDYRERLEEAGLVVAGTTPDGQLVEIIELPDHPFFIATQFHPEFKSRPFSPHPLFVEFIRAVGKKK